MPPIVAMGLRVTGVIAGRYSPHMDISHLDHLVLTVRDMQRSIDFYTQVLGMKQVTFGEGRHALSFGQQKINLHLAGREFEPKAEHPTPGSADLCFVTQVPIAEVVAHSEDQGAAIIEGPVQRTGATHTLLSVYLRDPDRNLIEISNHLTPHEQN